MMFFVTICQPTNYEKPQKNAFFSTKNIFVQNDALYLGPKFEYYLTNTIESPYSSF